ncbi:MAG: hypothetical protein LBR38_01645 [Synergistaceae bacterium]|jgi:hypothetical protein|nr:hypothetical protein [Synergistaceae bacterium]
MTQFARLKNFNIFLDFFHMDKFIENAEKLLPETKDDIYLCYSRSEPRFFQYLKNGKSLAALAGSVRFDRLFDDGLKQSKRVIIHSMNPVLFPYIVRIPAGIEVVWLPWGGDIYTCTGTVRNDALAPKTAAFVREHPGSSRSDLWRLRLSNLRDEMSTIMTDAKDGGVAAVPKALYRAFASRISRFFFKRGNEQLRHDALMRLDVVCAILNSEYEYLRKHADMKAVRKEFTYGIDFSQSFSGDLSIMAPELYDKVKDKFLILLGKSAKDTENHIDAIDALASLALPENALIICPLSYGLVGFERYGRSVADYAHHRLEDKFFPLFDLLPFETYNALLARVGAAIMNHRWQEAMGNVISLLYCGKKVFLDDDGDVYRMLKDQENAASLALPMSQLSVEALYSPPPASDWEAQKKYIVNRWGEGSMSEFYKNLLS